MAGRTLIAGGESRGTRVRRWLGEAADAAVSVFFPAGCRICYDLLTRASRVPICEACLVSFEAARQRRCEICGQSLPALNPVEGETPTCSACQLSTYAFARARSFGIYEGALARAILLLKWERMEPLGAWFAARLADLVRTEGRESEPVPAGPGCPELAGTGLVRPDEGVGFAADIVVPVPLHKDRERRRGYNQAALISKPLARKLGLPHWEMLLVRMRARPDKQVLSLEERWESVRGAFATRAGTQVDNLRVLLVDDVMTTGATLDACARALLAGGAKTVVGLTVARADRDPLPKGGHLGRQDGTAAKVG